jgi:N-acetylmuramoyl-L-alanine amidase
VRRLLRGLTAALAALALGGAAGARAEGPLVVIDAGHDPAQPGAVSVRGIGEVEYNDRLAGLIEQRLVRAGFRVLLTRRPGEERDLEARAAGASAARPWLLLSVHHDSAQPRLLEPVEREGRTVQRTTSPVRGFSLFVSGAGESAARSRQVAEALGRRLLALGRPPALHHAEPIPGEGRELLDARLGIYRFDELKLLRLAACPTVLLEAGVLADEADEAWLADPASQEALADAVVAALGDVRPP